MSTLDLHAHAVARAATMVRMGVISRSLVAAGTALAIVLAALVVLLTPVYLHAAHDVARSADYLGYTAAETLTISDRTVSELILGPGTFVIAAPDGTPFYQPSEAAHLGDARVVLYGFVLVALAGGVFTLATLSRRRRDPDVWRAISRGAGGLAVSLAVLGVLFALTFDFMFELFHRLFFPGGNWAFDPETQRLVQLYPIPFWQVTVGVLAVLAIGAGLLIWWFARRRARAIGASATSEASPWPA